ncbi:Ankyrin repeat protein 1 [Giardia muris]|uniref:Ankyrin repeat protein 1 n=1 Tax=Giardia muris TaxID=5742 RepID=A0A4Z1SQE7_GIAMU|nr:Ankyrin repeat protein 1 [Giardia muris]|eukprot:TNJ27900.1 Ankyrin repeat protein 1 [Giardia muris]
MEAARCGDAAAIHANLAQATQKDEVGRTALMYAARAGFTDGVKLLASREAGLKDACGMTALMYAVEQNRLDVAQILIAFETGQIIESGSHQGFTALMLAVHKGLGEMVQVLARRESRIAGRNGVTALMLAASGNRDDCARSLLAEVGMQTTGRIRISGKTLERGSTALMTAVVCGNARIVQLLAQHEASISDFRGMTAYKYATTQGDATILGILAAFSRPRQERQDVEPESSVPPGSPPPEAQNSFRIPDSRPQPQARPAQAQDSGMTPLMIAAATGDVHRVSLQIRDAGKQTTSGRTALMFATERGHVDCISLLLDKEVALQDNNGITALMFAAHAGASECARFLLSEVGITTKAPTAKFPAGTTALMIAAYYGRADIVKLLKVYEQGMKNSRGLTALDYAEQRGHTEIIQELSPLHNKSPIVSPSASPRTAGPRIRSTHAPPSESVSPRQEQARRYDGATHRLIDASPEPSPSPFYPASPRSQLSTRPKNPAPDMYGRQLPMYDPAMSSYRGAERPPIYSPHRTVPFSSHPRYDLGSLNLSRSVTSPSRPSDIRYGNGARDLRGHTIPTFF